MPTPEGLFAPEETLRRLHPAHARALTALSASRLPYLLLRLPVAAAGPAKDLDLLLAPDALGAACALLREAGFRPKTSPPGMPSKIVLATYDGGRFHSLDVHTAVVSRGLVYLDASLLLERRQERAGVALPSPEDALLHLVLHPLLGRREIGGKYADQIRDLAARPLDERYMRRHLARFGLGQVFRATLAAVVEAAPAAPAALHRTARRRLSLRVPANLLRRCRYRLAGTRLRRRAAVVAFVGVDGVGKSTLVAALEKHLSARGLRTASAYLGCWGRYQTRARLVASYSPRDAPAGGESSAQAAARTGRNLVKFGLFYGAILFEQWVRYARGVVRTPAHVVLCDRYLYDLELPFSRRHVEAGRRVRRWIYRMFPGPDLIFHLKAAPGEILARKAELTHEQLVRFDAVYARVLAGRPAVGFTVDAGPDDLAARIVEQFWEPLLEACWKHASSAFGRRALRAGARG